MRLAVVSDIHSNMDSFDAVLSDARNMNVDQIISLGDNIGYGPEPEAVMNTLDQMDIPSVMGNHEQALTDPEVLASFNPYAQKALKINKSLLSISSMKRIMEFKSSLVKKGCRFVHGLPPDTTSGYISKMPLDRLGKIIERLEERVVFSGHTHELALYISGPDGLEYKKFWKTRVSLAKDSKYIINSGSVGQPRNSHNKATYVILDLLEEYVESRVVPYDTSRTVRLMKRLGIPRVYSDLLVGGVLDGI
ncbi:MAG: metallophosphoesterase [Desulfobacterales bacterium]|nr:metallophosphoesterase [Desulfobacterales bacterium]